MSEDLNVILILKRFRGGKSRHLEGGGDIFREGPVKKTPCMIDLVHVHRVYESKRILSYLREKAFRSWNPVMANYMKLVNTSSLHQIGIFIKGSVKFYSFSSCIFVYCKLFTYLYEK